MTCSGPGDATAASSWRGPWTPSQPRAGGYCCTSEDTRAGPSASPARPALGRTFAAEDEGRGATRVAVVSDVLWRELSERHGMDRDDRTTWTVLRPTGLKTTKFDRRAHAILGPRVRSALDGLGSGVDVSGQDTRFQFPFLVRPAS